MRTVGVDLAAEPKGTGLAIVEWADDGARLVELRLDTTDADIVAAAGQHAVVGVDCPFGWPDAFIRFVTRHAWGGHPDGEGGKAWRQRLSYRATDVVVRDRVGRWPLSVSADRLGVTAMRCAELLAALETAGVPVDRSTRAGRVFEVYPAAALSLWQFETAGYKVDPARRAHLVDELAARAAWLDLGASSTLMVRSADAFDAVIAALVARAAALGRFRGPSDDLADQAVREGWAVLPDGGLAGLIGGTARLRASP